MSNSTNQLEPISVLTVGKAEAIQIWVRPGDSAPGPESQLQLLNGAGKSVCQLKEWEQVAEDRWNAALPEGIELWSMTNPVLYRLTGNLGDRQIDQQVGFRWWNSNANRYVELNGKPVYLRGVIRGISAHDHPNLTGMTDPEWHAKSITEIKKFGMNLVRWHSTVPPESYLEAADRLGFAVHIEIGFDKKNGQVIVDRDKWQRVLRSVCRHPSVAIYCVGNEIRRCGTVPQVQELAEMAREFDASALVMDNCGWGQPDRPNPDVYCQHVAYFFPYGKHERMFDYAVGFELEGKCDEESPHDARNPLRPVMGHEVCHYISMRDFDRLESKWKAWKEKVKPADDHEAAELPWWVEETRALYKLKGLDGQEEVLRKASRAYQELCQRHALESLRRSPALCGYEMLQQSDCWRYENSNGLLDSFDDPIHTDPEGFARFNADSVLLVDLAKRDFCFGSEIEVPVWISHYGESALDLKSLTVSIKGQSKELAVQVVPQEARIEIGNTVLLGQVKLTLAAGEQPLQGKLAVVLEHATGTLSQDWDVWLFPEVEASTLDNSAVVHELNDEVFQRLEAGESILWQYRAQELFDAEQSRAEYDFESRRDLFKGVIWDRGDNLGAVVRQDPVLRDFPHQGAMDWQLTRLVHEGCKINLDDFPVKVEPIIQGVGRPCRDRMQVMKLGMKEIQPKTTFRRWGWLFELTVGKGRLLVCGLNFTRNTPAGNYLKKTLMEALHGEPSPHAARLEVAELREYLANKAKEQRPTEGPMTLYWLADKDPVETTLFWEELGIRLE